MTRLNTNITSVAEVLGDTGMIQYTYAQALGHHREAELMVGIVRPDALIRDRDVNLSSGVRQSLPSGWRLRDVIINRGRTGALADGDPIRLVGRKMLQALASASTGYAAREETSQVVREIAYDERKPESFDVYPAMIDAASWVLLSIEGPPDAYPGTTEAANAAVNPSVPERYDPALREWVLWRFLSRMDDLTAEVVDGSAHYERFFQMLGMSAAADQQAAMKKLEQLR